MPSPEPPEPLVALRARRERLFRQLTWWEAHRASVLVPMALGTFGAGYGVGWALCAWAGAPSLTAYLLGVASLFVSGRLLDRHLSVGHLARLDHELARQERAVKAPGSARAPR
ncbi:MAG: hypothetical protein HY909_29490 [Deltaproteobacteria bacterium]|nr:hypothetical protein [Deltaproteobacteria bacterium]